MLSHFGNAGIVTCRSSEMGVLIPTGISTKYLCNEWLCLPGQEMQRGPLRGIGGGCCLLPILNAQTSYGATPSLTSQHRVLAVPPGAGDCLLGPRFLPTSKSPTSPMTSIQHPPLMTAMPHTQGSSWPGPRALQRPGVSSLLCHGCPAAPGACHLVSPGLSWCNGNESSTPSCRGC